MGLSLLRPAIKVSSFVVFVFGLMMAVPLLMALIYHTGNSEAFITAFAITETLALMGWLVSRGHAIQILTPRHMFLMTSLAWLVISLIGALPFFLSNDAIDLTDAVFESVSGLTTTGSTVLVGLDNMPHDILVWRSMLQWIGGLGVIGMAVAILPFLKVGGMKLFQTESSDWSDKAIPQSRAMVTLIIYVYILLTFLCTLAYMLAGMDSFHAVNHAMTTISTGGYSTSDQSFAQFVDIPSHWIAVLFMLVGAMPFSLYVHFMIKRQWRVFRDQQIKGFLISVALISLMLGVYLALNNQELDTAHAFTLAAFNVVSVVTTTGYASGDYSLWGSFAAMLFFFITFMGGCSGSTSGGIKVFRFQLFFMMLKESTLRAVHPRAILRRRYNGQPVDDSIIFSTAAFIFIVIISQVALTLSLSLCGLDLITSLTGAATALMNVGPGLGGVIGPAGNFASLPDTAKWLLSVGMLLGRLEFMTVILILIPAYWRG
ncbi:TrkH family potassium uptake protein [Spongiibacter taiwanensis]|uniref:TrkH family potassium uptake protein n=1 Tax=Spongiibacter taiwanensis TaxID=1748242 RepID=UPI002035F025|nr:TrkH family potassium uptake protein [Spongiibacter taiwanensis]USA41898.1 TrkH family potassium uptake protein [Spongiibacter taiwanensis]